MMKQKMTFKTILLTSFCALLAACNTTNNEAVRAEKIDTALQKAASQSASSKHSLGYLERIYTRNPDNALHAVNYARALRENEFFDKAAIVLKPFANSPDTPSSVKTEYAAIQLAMGKNKEAEDYAQQAIVQNDQDFNAYHYLGISLDARTEHEKAEKAYRKGLEAWQGDPTPIMNNLALNLASQEKLDEAIEILEKAKTLAPGRIEVERNLRIVRALQQSHGGYVPKPKSKPEKS